ncbi:hypothetical protein [Hymenobacter sp. HDW8]|nr:hypothetical protein [Hymenobacter sp. HDW8]QIL75068.1 hypothetical protein G7064_03760 [Hymenobacter sp. HDW8]
MRGQAGGLFGLLDLYLASAPLREVHQWVFGVLALESELVDARL